MPLPPSSDLGLMREIWGWIGIEVTACVKIYVPDPPHHQSSKFSLRSSSTFYKQTLGNSLRKDFNEANWLWSFIVGCHLTQWNNVFQRSKLEHIKVKVQTKIDYYVTEPSYQELSVNRNDCECYSLFFVLIIILLFLRLVITLYRYVSTLMCLLVCLVLTLVLSCWVIKTHSCNITVRGRYPAAVLVYAHI